MATTDTSFSKPRRGLHLGPQILVGLVAVLAPVGYFVGRTNSPVLAEITLGIMSGIPVGLFFGSARPSSQLPAKAARSSGLELPVLRQLRQELVENQALFMARKGSTTMFARIDYVASFWTAIKASGQLLVMQDTALLSTIAAAYYWLAQATRLERLAYDAKYASPEGTGSSTATRLISETRVLDGQVESSLDATLAAIDAALAAR